jgi:HrpA-like RNA helicase
MQRSGGKTNLIANKNSSMKVKAIIALVLGFVLATDALKADTPTASLPAGDQHVALLAQETNAVESAINLFKRCIDQDRPNAEAVNAFNVLADNYDRLCAHLLQFYVWAKDSQKSAGAPPFNLSPASQEQLRDLSLRINTSMQDEWKEITDTLKQKPQYTRDPAMQAVGQRIVLSTNTLNTFRDQADKQFEELKQ